MIKKTLSSRNGTLVERIGGGHKGRPTLKLVGYGYNYRAYNTRISQPISGFLDENFLDLAVHM